LKSSFKILIVSSEFPPGPGGIGNHAYNLCRYLSTEGNEVTAMTVSDYTDESASQKFDKEQDFEIIRFKRYENKLKTFSKRIKLLKDKINASGVNLIIFSGRFSLYSSLFIGKKNGRIKFIAIAHGTDVNAGNTVEKMLIKKALSKMDLIIPVSKFSSQKLPESISRNKVNIIPNGFDIEGISAINSNPKNLTEGKLNLITVGSLSPRKGQHNVLNAMPELISEYPYIKYNIAGRITDDSRIKKYIDKSDIRDRVIIHGQVTNRKLYEIIQSSDIFIILSEQQAKGSMEGFGIAILEANFFGLPAIGSRNSGIADAISEGKNGILVNPANTGEIAEAVKKIVNKYEDYSRNAVEWAGKHHWSKIIKRYTDAINKLN